jgi:tRNA (guanine-N7-)-methyltransferase
VTEDRKERAVRSFVLRAGRTTAAQQRALERLWPRYGVDYHPARLDLDDVFGRTATRILEVGFGDGESLLNEAAREPETDFLGIEVHRPGVGHCLMRADALGLHNLRIICHDAVEVLERQIPRESVGRVNLYFPDPWPKKRHHKRRLVQPRFAELVARCLAPGGRLYIATDWPNYAEQIDEVFEASRSFELHARREHSGEAPLDRPTTKFERRALKLGHRIVDWRFDRVQPDP